MTTLQEYVKFTQKHLGTDERLLGAILAFKGGFVEDTFGYTRWIAGHIMQTYGPSSSIARVYEYVSLASDSYDLGIGYDWKKYSELVLKYLLQATDIDVNRTSPVEFDVQSYFQESGGIPKKELRKAYVIVNTGYDVRMFAFVDWLVDNSHVYYKKNNYKYLMDAARANDVCRNLYLRGLIVKGDDSLKKQIGPYISKYFKKYLVH